MVIELLGGLDCSLTRPSCSLTMVRLSSYSSVVSSASATCSSADEMDLAVYSHASRMCTDQREQSESVAK